MVNMFSRKILNGTTVFNIDNNQKCFLSTKDWNKGCWIFRFAINGINNILNYINIAILNCKNISHFFVQINTALLRITDFFQNH